LLVTAARKCLAGQITAELLNSRLLKDGPLNNSESIEVYKVAESLDQKLSRYAISSDVLPGDLVSQVLNKIAEISKQEKVIFVCSKFSRSILANIIKQDSRNDIVLSSEELVCNFSVKGELSLEAKIISLKKQPKDVFKSI
jgi:flagellar biosynthesis component FlhA